MLSYSARIYFRRAVAASFVGFATILAFGVWSGHLLPQTSKPIDASHFDAVLSTVLSVTATVGAIALAVVFLTAQLSASRSRPSTLAELYRSSEVYVLFGAVTLTVAIGFIALGLDVRQELAGLEEKLIDTVLVLGMSSVLLVFPALMSQLENLNPITLAAKLSARVGIGSIIDYGLVLVWTSGTAGNIVAYKLATAGLRPHSVDLLRPLHEILMEAVETRDRVLFGKIFRYVLLIVARVHGACLDVEGHNHDAQRPGMLKRLSARRYDSVARVHVSLTILHYAVKRARNLLAEWGNRDIGRHGILTGIGDLIRALALAQDSRIAIRISLYAALHISIFYQRVKPYGRLEPLNAYFVAANELDRAHLPEEARLCIQLLAWNTVHSQQLTAERSSNMYGLLDERLRNELQEATNNAESQHTWLPGIDSEDPWRRWPS
jgi:hypothetical protein